MKKITLIVSFIAACWAQQVTAATATSANAVTNNFLFIENDIDNEYFITPRTTDPRFSGANVWMKYQTNQRSLGYIGTAWTEGNQYKDMWFSNSPIDTPFLGLRCMTGGATCPSGANIPGDVTDASGFYHARSGSDVYSGSYAFATLSSSAYEYFKAMNVGGSETLVLNYCNTAVNYDYAAGVRCKDVANATWRYRNFILNKLGHLTLVGTNALAELFVASDGTPSINSGSNFCNVAVVQNVSGVTCQMISYRLNQTAVLNDVLYFRMHADSSVLGFTPAATSVKFSGDGTNWYNYSATTTAYSRVFTTSGEYVYVFLSNTFLRAVVNAGTNISTSTQPFTFSFRNTRVVESGFYEFTPSSAIVITPKEYGISIVASDGEISPSGTGTIGGDDIELDYRVTVSGPQQADAITAQVTGSSVILDSIPYCLFTSADNSVSVPVPARLSYTSASGTRVRKSNSCSEEPISLNDAQWTATAWDASKDDGYYYSTDLKLLFPMSVNRSFKTVSGDDWEGTVSASGEIKVTATWIGVTAN